MSDLRSWINPYRARITEYADRIFEIAEGETDKLAVVEAILAQAQECYCEIGSGSGNHLVALGAQNPIAAVFGFEIRYKRSVRTIEKAQDLNAANVYVFRMPAEEMQRIFQPGSLDRVYVNFPDPWAKRKQWKHRVLNENFLDMMHALLKAQGFVSVKTDHKEYFAAFQKLLHADSRFRVLAETNDYHGSDYCKDNIETEFEMLFKHKGKPINFLSFNRANS